MASIGSLVVNIAGNTKPLQRTLAKSEKLVSGFAKRTTAIVRGAMSSLFSLKSLAVTALGGIVTSAAATGMIKLAAEAETLNTQFEVLTGSASVAKQLMSEIDAFAASTPFQKMEIADSARALLAFGGNAETVVGELKMLGDLAAGTGNTIGELADLYGKAKVQGRLFGEDINQLTGRGIPVIQELAKQFGVADGEVKKLVEQGKVGFPELQKALQSLTSDGGKFQGLMDRLSTTTAGKWSTFKDNVALAATEMGTKLLPVANKLLDWGIKFSQSIDVNKLGAFIQAATKPIVDMVDSLPQSWEIMTLKLKRLWVKLVDDMTLKLFELELKASTFFGTKVSDTFEDRLKALGNPVVEIDKQIQRLEDQLKNKPVLKAEVKAAPIEAVAGVGGGIDTMLGLKGDLPTNDISRMPQQGPKDFAEAQIRNTAGAYSAILAALKTDGKDPQVQAIKQQTGELLKPLSQMAAQLVGGGMLAIVNEVMP